MGSTGVLGAAAAALGLARSGAAQSGGHAGHGQSPPPSNGSGWPRSVELAGDVPAPSARTEVPAPPADGAYRPVVTPNGRSLPWRWKDGVKEFQLVAEPVVREFAPGMVVNCWGYNGQTPGPTIEAVEGDRVRIYVTNKLPEWTVVHWHGIRLPNGMDGVGGLTQPHIPPGRTGVYEFTLRDSGTFMYHPHADEMVQMAMGLMGFLIVHPKNPSERAVDRDFCIMLHAWDVRPGTATPVVTTMLDFNMWTFNSRVWPGTEALAVRLGDRLRIRIANLSMTSHPIHLHGHHFRQVATDGGWIPESGQWPMTSMNVPVGSTAVLEVVADAPGDWAIHCHKTHHTMNAMGHDVPTLIGVDQRGLETKLTPLLPEYMAMGSGGMADMAHMQAPLPPNTLPMMTGTGPFGPIEMGGMFTIVKVREVLAPGDYQDPGWYAHPKGTVSYLLDG
jgi:FtsP/CotA-like multicopper oxidase with cupredoxin domain